VQGDVGVAPAPRPHLVAFYNHDDDLTELVVPFVEAALAEGGSAVIVAMAAHLASFTAALTDRGVDLEAGAGAGRYVALDAYATLGHFMIDGEPDPTLFQASIGTLLERLTQGDGPVRVFGEMVGVLWREGNVGAAFALEELWNDLATTVPFELFCGYHERLVGADGAAQVCRHHSALAASGGAVTPLPAIESVRDGSHESQWFEGSLAAPAAARRFVADTLARWGWLDMTSTAQLVASELATNAVRHGRGRFRLSLTAVGDRVTIGVYDTSPGRPVIADITNFREGGRGLDMVASLAGRYGIDTSPGGKTVWAELGRHDDLVP
jgi:anti-sigma regulatory factor (Ser/Thr protein kinase)